MLNDIFDSYKELYESEQRLHDMYKRVNTINCELLIIEYRLADTSFTYESQCQCVRRAFQDAISSIHERCNAYKKSSTLDTRLEEVGLLTCCEVKYLPREDIKTKLVDRLSFWESCLYDEEVIWTAETITYWNNLNRCTEFELNYTQPRYDLCCVCARKSSHKHCVQKMEQWLRERNLISHADFWKSIRKS